MKVNTLKKNPGNPRQIKGDKLDKLKASVGGFQKMMALRPMIVDENNVVLGGNMRLAAIKALKLKEIPDEWVKKVDDLTADEKAQFIITDNSSFGEYDYDEIANSWTDYPLADWGLDVPDYETVDEAGNADAEPQIDKAAELNKKWKVKSGDLWLIGEHRLLCGDSTSPQAVDKVLDGAKAAVVADPPYGMGWNAKITCGPNGHGVKGAKGANFGKTIQNDDTPFDPSPFLDFSSVVLWGSNHYSQRLPKGTTLVWIKKHDENFGKFLSDAETAWMKGGEGVYCFRDTSLIAEANNRLHTNQKPVGLMAWCIEKSAKPEQTILDPFAGSGTTLVACQNLNRKCYAIEISESYCAVILERMQTAFPDIEIKRG